MDERSCYILLVLLEQSDYITFKEISDIIEERYHYTCNIKSIGVSIQSINTFFYLIFGIEEAVETIKKKGSKISQSILNSGEIRFLYDALTSNTSIPTQDGSQLFQKIVRLIPQSMHPSSLEEVDSSMFLIYLDSILKAIHEKRAIRFQYINYNYDDGTLKEEISNRGNDDDPSYYIVSPYRITMVRGKYYLTGYYSKHKDTMTNFRLDRMRNVRIKNKSLYMDKGDEWDVENQIKNAVNMYSGNHDITLELYCHKKILRQVVDEFHDKIAHVVLSNDPDYLNIIIEEVNESVGLIGWIMMMSPDVKVIKPATLVEDIVNRLDTTIKQYQ